MSKILIVEDDATMRVLLKTLLELDGHKISLLTDPKQDVFQYVEDVQPEILIMDVNLRYHNGIEILKEIRKRNPESKIRILMTSGMNFKDESVQAGADGFLLKPYMPEELNKQLKAVQAL
jgi:DNA-binding response OmpR family regulator